MDKLTSLLAQSSEMHRHLCPRQVLGVRMGLFAGEMLGLELPQPPKSKRLFTIVETDGCCVDGVSAATNCWIGRRTMRVEDLGKVAATFVDTRTNQLIRIAPRHDVRQTAPIYAPEARNKWESMLLGYQRMPMSSLFEAMFVQLNMPVSDLISRPGVKAICDQCGEEIINQREVESAGVVLCRSCAGYGYYHSVEFFRVPEKVLQCANRI